ncbi:putative disease resistance protein [Tanacetum coccineum]
MNDLATSVAGDIFSRFDNQTEIGFRKKAFEKYRHISFVRDQYEAYNKFKTFGKNSTYQIRFSVELLPSLPLLRVLCLSDYEISEVPEPIGNLKHLRYLNLSRTRITQLPENVCNLYNLQTLIIYGCRRLTKLPNSFSKLKNLRHFDIRDTPLLMKMPLGIGELKSLQTLSKIIIGGDNGFAITELKELKNLRGDVSIKGLEKVKNAMHAREAQISQKRLSELEVEWSNLFDGSRKETLEKEVLDVLKPHTNNLKSLKVVSYGGVEFPNWVGDPSFLRLTHVSIRGCKKCTSLPPLGQLPSLKQLFIQGMHEVKFVGSELLGTGLAFPSLEFLSFNDMQGWKVWSTNSDHVVFPSLQELLIINCPRLVEISTEALPSLRVLEIRRCGYGVLQSVVHNTSSITKLELESISGLTDEVWRDVILYLGEVEEVRLDRCNEIRYFWVSEAHAGKVLMNLRELELWSCNDLVSLAEKEEDNCGSNLKMLEIWFCNSMTRCICPNNIQKLKIDRCSSITSVSLPTQKLKSVLIYDCKKLLEEELVGEKSNLLFKNKNTSMLENVRIRGWSNLRSITELSYFINLREIQIEDCPSMESIPDHEFPSLTLLKHMTILNCPSMDSSFPRGLWPVNLHSLVIGQLKKPISQWGLQNFPTSLVHL